MSSETHILHCFVLCVLCTHPPFALLLTPFRNSWTAPIMVFIPNPVVGVMMAILPVTSFSPGIFAKVKVYAIP